MTALAADVDLVAAAVAVGVVGAVGIGDRARAEARGRTALQAIAGVMATRALVVEGVGAVRRAQALLIEVVPALAVIIGKRPVSRIFGA